MKSNMKRKVIILIFLSPRILNSDKSPHSPTREIMRIQLFIYKTYFGNFSAVVVTFPSIRKAKTNTFKMMKLSNSIFKKKSTIKYVKQYLLLWHLTERFEKRFSLHKFVWQSLFKASARCDAWDILIFPLNGENVVCVRMWASRSCAHFTWNG